MNSSDFFSVLTSKTGHLASSLGGLVGVVTPPIREKALLVLNHVVAQEPEAMERLKTYAGRIVALEGPLVQQWRLMITPAGLFEEVLDVSDLESVDENQAGGQTTQTQGSVDLYLKMKAFSPLDMGNMLLKGVHPPVDIVGDADLAAVFAWLTENLRWDYAQDLSKIVGDTPAQLAVDQLHKAVGLLRGFFDAINKRTGRSGE